MMYRRSTTRNIVNILGMQLGPSLLSLKFFQQSNNIIHFYRNDKYYHFVLQSKATSKFITIFEFIETQLLCKTFFLFLLLKYQMDDKKNEAQLKSNNFSSDLNQIYMIQV
ncbi:hypothetical protein pb186bvf_000404 [Paramecium bursaria]